MCSLCRKKQETTTHLLLHCDFAKSIWQWLASTIKVPCNFNSIQEVINVSQRRWSPLCKVVVLSTVINCLNTIWFCRNQMIFADKKINYRSVINLIILDTSMTGNNSKCAANSSIADFVLLKAFSVKINYGNAPKIKEIIWQPPVFDWIKCNIDGAFLSNPGPSSCGRIFRDKNADFLGAFAYNLGITNSLVAELNGAIYAIELAHLKGWNHMSLETDYVLVALAFKSKKIVPWHLRKRWDNCLQLLSSMSFFVTHIYRKEHHCADQLASIGLSLNTYFWWIHLPQQIGVDFTRNRLGLSPPLYVLLFSYQYIS